MRLLLGYMLGLSANVSLYRAARVAKGMQEAGSAVNAAPDPEVDAMAGGPALVDSSRPPPQQAPEPGWDTCRWE